MAKGSLNLQRCEATGQVDWRVLKPFEKNVLDQIYGSSLEVSYMKE